MPQHVLDWQSSQQLCFCVSAPRSVPVSILRQLFKNGNPQQHSLEWDYHIHFPVSGLPSAKNLPFPWQLEHCLLCYPDHIHLHCSFPGGVGFPVWTAGLLLLCKKQNSERLGEWAQSCQGNDEQLQEAWDRGGVGSTEHLHLENLLWHLQWSLLYLTNEQVMSFFLLDLNIHGCNFISGCELE